MMRVQNRKGTYDEDLVVVFFERVHFDTKLPTIEVVFSVYYPTGIGGPNSVLTFLSATRTDTRQPVTLTDEEFRQTSEAASEHPAEI